jgi:hypothetical protein
MSDKSISTIKYHIKEVKSLAFKFLTLLGLAPAFSCASRAPTQYELDKRAGLLSVAESKEETNQKIVPSSANAAKLDPKKPEIPRRASPWFERLWVYDQETKGGYWLQGTFVFVEIEPGRWIKPGEEP